MLKNNLIKTIVVLLVFCANIATAHDEADYVDGVASGNIESSAPSASSVKKTPVPNKNFPDLSEVFTTGLKVSNFKELFIISGHGALTPDFQIRHAGNPAAQARHIFLEVQKYMAENGYSFNDLIQIQMTITKEVTDEQFGEVVEVYKGFMKGIAVLPTGGTMRVVDRLAFPGMLVEFEFMAAK